jgi:cytochrome c peroxidase
VFNRAYSLHQFWDGRAATLEEQAKGPMANPVEMGNTHEALVTKLRSISGYGPLFEKTFGTKDWDIEHIAKAIATFERTVLSGNSAYDQYKSGKKNAMTAQQVRGMQLFSARLVATLVTKASISPLMPITTSASEPTNQIRTPVASL